MKMNRKGITLIELLVALGVSGILLAGVYRTFISQQHTFTVQEQVVDMQQNVRLAINRMTRELRMAGYGRMDSTFFAGSGMYGIYKNVVTPGGDGKSVTIVGGYRAMTTLSANAAAGPNPIQVNDASGFDLVNKKYISINGLESHQIETITGNQIEFPAGEILATDHLVGETVFLVMAITYSIGPFEGKQCLLRDDHLGSGPLPVAENIDDLQFRYVMNTGETLDVVPNNRRDDIRMIQLTIVARTDRTDPELAKVGDGFRRRTLTSNIQLRNLSF
jgi:type IV pilus assembly protein PilW